MPVFIVFSIFSSLVIICNFNLKNLVIGTINVVVVVVVVAAMHLHETRKISDVLNF